MGSAAGRRGDTAGRRGGGADTTSQSSAAARATLLGMAGTGGRGRPGRRLRRVDETSAGGLVVADDGVTGPRAALIGRTDRRGRLLWSPPKGHIEAGGDPGGTPGRQGARGDRGH